MNAQNAVNSTGFTLNWNLSNDMLGKSLSTTIHSPIFTDHNRQVDFMLTMRKKNPTVNCIKIYLLTERTGTIKTGNINFGKGWFEWPSTNVHLSPNYVSGYDVKFGEPVKALYFNEPSQSDRFVSVPIIYESGGIQSPPTQGSNPLNAWPRMDPGYFCDFALIVEMESLPVHRSVLGTNSPVFRALFDRNDMDENKNGQMIIKDFRAKTVKAALDFIYTGNLNPDGVSEDLFAFADKYDFKLLVKACTRICVSRLCPATLFDMLTIADRYNIVELKNRAIKLFVSMKGSGEIVREAFVKFKQDNPNLALELFEASMQFAM